MDIRRYGGRLLLAAEIAALLLVAVFSVVAVIGQLGQEKHTIQRDAPAPEQTVSADAGRDAYRESRIAFATEVEEKLASMTTEEKVAQLFVVTPEAYTNNERVSVAGPGCQAAVTQYPVGGILCGRENFLGYEATAGNLARLQEYSNARIGVNLLLVVDAGAEGSEAVANADYMKSVGLNGMLHPAAVPASSEETANLAQSLQEQTASANAAGYAGVVSFVPDRIMENAGASEELLNGYRSAFISGAKEAWAVMVGGGSCKLLTGKSELPLTFSTDVVKLLRNEMGFEGVLVSAPLSGADITASYSAGDAAVAALKAGMDMIFLPPVFTEAYDAVLAAVGRGEIPAESLDNSVGRILTMKYALSAAEPKPQEDEDDAQDEQADNRENRNNNGSRNNGGNRSNGGNNGGSQPTGGGQPQPVDPDPQPANPDPQPADPDPQPANPDPQPADPDPQPADPDPQPVVFNPWDGYVSQPEGT